MFKHLSCLKFCQLTTVCTLRLRYSFWIPRFCLSGREAKRALSIVIWTWSWPQEVAWGGVCSLVSGLLAVTGLDLEAPAHLYQGCSQLHDWVGRHLLVSVAGLGEGHGSVIEDHSRYRTERRPQNDAFSETQCSFWSTQMIDNEKT
jgi:hypothetical protein